MRIIISEQVIQVDANTTRDGKRKINPRLELLANTLILP
jgi:hypothetical protein